MRVNILPVLSGALLLSACGSSVGGSTVVGEDLPACDTPSKLADFNLPEPLTGLEVRTFFTGVGEGESNPVVRTLGQSCSSTTCAAEVEQLDSQRKGWEFVAAGERSIGYVIGINEGALVGSATSDAELLALIGPIDTVAEAKLVAELKGHWCVRAGEKDGALQVVSSETIEDCAPIVVQEVLYRLDSDASVHELERGEKKVASNACIGRRPAGLTRRKPTAQRSPTGDFLARSAELEAASVISFRVLETELRSHRAPEELLQRVREAADDEVIHARLMHHLAERFGGRPSERTVRVAKVRELEAIALENAVEGCVAETWGCLIGMHQAEHAKGSLLRHAYQRIARDEARHAQLSWDIAAWAETQLDAAGRERVARGRAAAVHDLASAVAEDSAPASLREVLGLPDAATRQRLFSHVNHALWS